MWQTYLWCAAGVALSILIPVLARAVRSSFDLGSPAARGRTARILGLMWRVMRPYVALAALSLTVAAVIVAMFGEALGDPGAALIAGYAWDSTLQKIAGKP